MSTSAEGPGRRGRGGSRRSRDDQASPAADGLEAAHGESGNSGAAESGESSQEQLARDMVYRLLAVRARSRSELRQALDRKEIEAETAERVLQKFVDAGLVDDAAFAENWVNERHQNQGLGRKALGFELRRKGVEENLVAEALSTIDEGSEGERARELVRRKLPSMTRVDATKRTRRLVGMLARKGYGEGMAFRIVREETEHLGLQDADGEVETP